ncbi:MAG: hypothetical protein IT210_10370 [Armatimonadetes bacterium]|nr:hypothetical protein [Armatimonadota bacterium]
MTAREVIRRNLEGDGPVRIGLDFDRGRRYDFHGAGPGPSKTWTPRRWVEGDTEYYDDEWGNIWHRLVRMSKGGEIYRPALTDWDMLEGYRLPDLADPERYEAAAQSFAADKERFRLGSLPGFPFAICRYLRKMEIYFQDLVLERERIDLLHDRVTGLLEAMIVRWADAGADGIFFCEDWGVQDRLLIRPGMWREIYKPLFARLCGAARERGMHVLMHSCGYNWDILDDLAEAGIKAFQFDQPALYGLERLADKLNRLGVCLYAPVDIQKIMPFGNRQQIEGEARRMIALFDGHLIAKNYGDLHGIGVEEEWDGWAYRVFEKSALEKEGMNA